MKLGLEREPVLSNTPLDCHYRLGVGHMSVLAMQVLL